MQINRSNIISILLLLGVVYVFFITYIIAKFIKNKQIRDAELIKAIMLMNMKNTANPITLKDMALYQGLLTKPEHSIKDNSTCDTKINTNYQTDFFIQSAAHAESVLNTKVILEQYRYGNWMDLTKLDNETKASIIIAIKYMSIEPIQARALEQQYRAMSESEKVPLWMVILHEAIKKVISSKPNIEQLSDEELASEIKKRELANQNIQNSTSEPKVIPIGRVA